jgi:hypothetical protein
MTKTTSWTLGRWWYYDSLHMLTQLNLTTKNSNSRTLCSVNTPIRIHFFGWKEFNKSAWDVVGIGNYTPWPFTSTFFVCALHPDIILTYTLRRKIVENIQVTCSVSSILWPQCRGCTFVIVEQIPVWTWQTIIGSLSRAKMPTVYRNWIIIIFLLQKWNHCWIKHSLAK